MNTSLYKETAPPRKIIDEMKNVIIVPLSAWWYTFTVIRPVLIIELKATQAVIHAVIYKKALSFIFIADAYASCYSYK